MKKRFYVMKEIQDTDCSNDIFYYIYDRERPDINPIISYKNTVKKIIKHLEKCPDSFINFFFHYKPNCKLIPVNSI